MRSLRRVVGVQKPSSSASFSADSGDKPRSLDRDHWDAVARDVKSQFRSDKRKTLGKIREVPIGLSFLLAGGMHVPVAQEAWLVRAEEQGSLCANAADKKNGARFEFEWKAQEDEEKAITHPFEISALVCTHRARADREAERVLAPDVLEALFWTYDPQQLQDRLASIFHDLSHTSTFARGRASISEMMIKAIAAHHGYTLEFSSDWTAPNPSPDMQALSEFDRDKFIQAARSNIILWPMIDVPRAVLTTFESTTRSALRPELEGNPGPDRTIAQRTRIQ